MLVDLVALVVLTITAPFTPVPISHHRDREACERAFADLSSQVGGTGTVPKHYCVPTVVPTR